MNVRPTRVFVVIVTFAVWLGAMFVVWLLQSQFIVSSRQILANLAASYLLMWGLYWLLSAGSPVEKSLRFFVSTTTLLVITGVLEFAAFIKVVDYRNVFRSSEGAIQSLRYADKVLDPELLHIRKPHLHLRGSFKADITQEWDLNSAASYPYDIRYDRNGFRNSTDYQSAEYVVIGDSFVESWEVADEELFTTRLATLSGKTVANLGQGGYGPQQDFHVLRRFGVALQPKICVWVFFEGNDLLDVGRYNEAIANWNNHAYKFDTFTQRSFTRNFLWQLLSVLRHRPIKGAPPSGVFVPVQGDPVRLYFRYESHALSEGGLNALDETVSTLAKAHELCLEHGIKLVVVFAPTKFRVYKAFCEFEPDSATRRWVLNDLPQRLKSAVQGISDQILFVDLTPTLIEHAAKGPLLYLVDDSHWGPEGHRVVAETLADSLRQQPQKELTGQPAVPQSSAEFIQPLRVGLHVADEVFRFKKAE